MMQLVFWALLLVLLNACSLIQDKPVEGYHLSQMQHLQNLANWYFEGRVAMSNEKDSISASISWRHNSERDEIELSGPLAQGKIAILVTTEKVLIDDGEHPQEYFGQVDAVISEQLGVDMPISALRFWVLGVSDPLLPKVELESGFMQDNWLVSIRELQRLYSELLPRKLNVEKNQTRIKLIIDQWKLL